MAKGKGSRLSLYEKVYRELDKIYIGAERQREVPTLPGESRYDGFDEIGIDANSECTLVIKAATPERLNFAQRVAEYYKAPFNRGEKNISKYTNPSERYFIKIDVSETK